MTLNFVIPELHIGGAGTPPLQFFRRGFVLGGTGGTPTWQDVILKGSTALTLINSKANSLQYLKLYGGCSQADIPTPSNPVDIVCNNGVIKARMASGLPLGYQRVKWITSTKGIDLGIQTTQNTVLQTRLYRASSAAQYAYVSDSNSSGTSNTTAYVTNGGNWRFGNKTLSIQVTTDTWHTTQQSKDGVKIDGSTLGTYGTISNFTSSSNLYAFGSADTAPLRIDYIKERTYGNLTTYNHEWVACKRYDNVYGLYDMIGNTFHTNANATVSGGNIDDSLETYIDTDTIETVNVHSSNLFDASSDAVKLGYYVGTSGANKGQELASSYNFISKNYIPIKPNTSYVLFGRKKSDNTLSAYNRIYWYDANKEYLSVCSYTQNTVTVATSPANAYYAKYGINESGGSSTTVTQEIVDSYNWTLCEGDTEPSTFTPYWVGDSATATDLLAIGTHKDVQEVHTGSVTRNIGIKVMDGTEEWTESSTSGTYYSATLPYDSLQDVSNVCFCTHYKGVSPNTSVASMTNLSAKCGTSSNRKRVYVRDTSVANASGLQTYMLNQYNAGTPVIFVYTLTTPTTEHVTGQSINIKAGTNVIEITQASIDGLELEAKYKAGVTVTVEEIEDAQLSNDVTVTVS